MTIMDMIVGFLVGFLAGGIVGWLIVEAFEAAYDRWARKLTEDIHQDTP